MNQNLNKFVKINPFYNLKGIAIQILDDKQKIEACENQQIEALCLNCKKWLRRQVKIITDSQEIYCVGCFSSLLPICQFYKIYNHQSFEIVGQQWPARDELLLLIALEKFGFGNWTAIQQYMAYLGANYFMDEIQYHYDNFYGKTIQNSQYFIQHCNLVKKPNPSRKNKSRKSHGGKSIQKSTFMCSSRVDQQQNQYIPCYNSKRRQFNIQYKENLQKYIADLEFRQNDSQKEIQLKFKILEAYNLGLEDRLQKHNFILEHKLLDQNYQAQQKKFLQLNPYANKAHQLLIELMRTMSRQQYLQIRKSLQFCFKIQAIVDSLREARNSSGKNLSLHSIVNFDKMNNQSIEQLSKPKKRVHKNPQNIKEEKEKAILKKLNLSKQELKTVINKAKQKNQAVIYKDIKITPLNNLIK